MIGDNNIPAAAILNASTRLEVALVMDKFYAELDQRITEQDLACKSCGECCEFAEFGHRLYVTSLEMAYYLAKRDPTLPVTEDACPHVYDGKCQAHDARPAGCRIFFCNSDTTHWQGPLTEESLTRLKTLHAELKVPYCYVDWITALKAINAHS